MDFSNTLFRCSSLGHLMASPVSKADKEAGNLSEGAKTHLIDVYVSCKYNRQTDIGNKYINKGNMVEEDSITLFSRLKKRFFKKNEESLFNDFIKGTPDLYEGSSIKQAETIIDIKSSWDLYTFMRVLSKDINSLYYWQLQGYMALTGATKAVLAYCLIDTPLILINDEKRKLMYKMGAVTTESPDFIEACEVLEQSMTYGDIPKEEKVIEYSIERNDADIQRLYEKIKKARTWLNEFEHSRIPSAIMAEYQQDLQATIISGIKLTKI